MVTERVKVRKSDVLVSDKYIEKRKKLCSSVMDLEKAYDRVDRGRALWKEQGLGMVWRMFFLR